MCTGNLCPLVLVGNKSDLENKRGVDWREGQKLADSFGVFFFEVSAKTGENIDKVYHTTSEGVYTRRYK